MSAQRAGCASRLLYQDRHAVGSRPWVVITPQGQTVSLCSEICLLEFVCEPVPVESGRRRNPWGPPPARPRRLELVR